MKEIELSKKGKRYKGKFKALVDDDIFNIVNQYSWTYQKGYAYNAKMKILLHRFIYELKVGKIPEDKIIDHMDRNPLNNQLNNLRLATVQQNSCNIGLPKHNTSNFLGISKETQKNKCQDGIHVIKHWRTRIMYKGKEYIKRFPYTDEGLQQAIQWRKEKQEELFKEFNPDENK